MVDNMRSRDCLSLGDCRQQFNSVKGITVLKATFLKVRYQLKMDFMFLCAPGLLLNRRLSMRPSPEELEERNILKSKLINIQLMVFVNELIC
jgi:hypothetical protein